MSQHRAPLVYVSLDSILIFPFSNVRQFAEIRAAGVSLAAGDRKGTAVIRNTEDFRSKRAERSHYWLLDRSFYGRTGTRPLNSRRTNCHAQRQAGVDATVFINTRRSLSPSALSVSWFSTRSMALPVTTATQRELRLFPLFRRPSGRYNRGYYYAHTPKTSTRRIFQAWTESLRI